MGSFSGIEKFYAGAATSCKPARNMGSMVEYYDKYIFINDLQENDACFKDAAPSFKPANKTTCKEAYTPERMNQSDERKNTSVPDRMFVSTWLACSLIFKFRRHLK